MARTARLYRRLIAPILFRIDAERSHRLAISILSAIPRLPASADSPELAAECCGFSFSNPVGLAAGMDKDARAVRAWEAMGFGFAELGTVTPEPQAGNPPPRLWRIPAHQALVNRLGFPSRGMEAAAVNLRSVRRHGTKLRIGLNFGPNRETPVEKIVDDYAALMQKLGAMADFVVLNVSSPNTPGLRDWQKPDRMRKIIAAVSAAASGPRPPILVKVAPDLDAGSLDSLCDAALEAGVSGIVATNTTISREGAASAARLDGGLSGQPLRERARAVIGQIFRRCGKRLPIIGVGGIFSAEDAYRHIKAGASLVELYTGLIYAGPCLVREIKEGLVELLRRDGLSSIQDAVGTSVR